MENVVYIDEKVREEVYKGTLVLDGHMSEEEQRKMIFDMMEKDGVSVQDDSQYEIGYVGADDNDGLSDIQTSDFVVTRVYNKKVPYIVKKEEIYTGEYVLDSLRITPEEQENKVIEMMKKDGIDVASRDEIEIGYVGADDNDGLSDTQSSKFVVYKVTKRRADDTSLVISDAQKIYDELVSLREKVANAKNSGEVMALLQKVNSIDEKIDTLSSSNSRDYQAYDLMIAGLNSEIEELEKQINSKIAEYQENYDRVKQIMTDGLVSDSYLSDEKLSESDLGESIKAAIDALTSELTDVKKKRQVAIKDYETAKALGISASEYIEITDSLKKRNIINSILEKKGLSSIIGTPEKKRSSGDRKLLKDAKDEILKEIASARKENVESSILDLINALYGLESEVQLDGKQRVLIVRPTDLSNIYGNIRMLPEKIIRKEVKVDYTPAPAPSDMLAVIPNKETHLSVIEPSEKSLAQVQEKETELVVPEESNADDAKEVSVDDIKNNTGLVENFTFFIDIKNQNSVYVRKYVFERFHIDPVDSQGVRIDGELCYPISLDDFRYIANNANNSYSPYTVRQDSIEFDRENGLIEQFTFFVDLDSTDSIYARRYVFDRFNLNKKSETPVRINGELCYSISKEDVQLIVDGAKNDISPYVVGFDSVDFNKEKRNVMVDEKPVTDFLDKFVIFIDKDTEKYYVRKPVFERFNIDNFGLPATIEGTLCFEISHADADYIINNANNNYSPYIVEFKKIKAEVIDNTNELYNSVENRGLIDKYTIFRDIDTRKLYVRKPVFDRFNAEPIGDEVRIKGVAGYEISDSVAQYIVSNADNNYSPYVVDYVNLHVSVNNNANNVVMPYDEEASKLNSDGEYKDFKDKTIPYDENASKLDLNGEFKDTRDRVIPVDENRGLIDKFTLYKDLQSDRLFAMKPVFKRFNIPEASDEVRINGIASHEISKSDAEFIIGNANNSYSPYVVSDVELPLGLDRVIPYSEEASKLDSNGDYKDLGDRVIPVEENRGLIDKFTLYKDLQSDRLFAMKPVFKRFNIPEASDEVRINGIACYEIAKSDADFIRGNANNSYSPYVVSDVELPLGLDRVIPYSEEASKLDSNGDYKDLGDRVIPVEDSRGLTDKFTLYKDMQSDRLFAMKPVFKRFNIPEASDEVRINGVASHEISKSDAEFIRGNANNSYSPYVVSDVELPLGLDRVIPYSEEASKLDSNGDYKDLGDRVIPVEESRGLTEKIVLYKDIHSDRIFAKKPVFERFNISEESLPVRINGVVCHEIDPEDALFIVRNSDNKYSPYAIEYQELPLGLDRIIPYNDELSRLDSNGDFKDLGDRIIPVDDGYAENVIEDVDEVREESSVANDTPEVSKEIGDVNDIPEVSKVTPPKTEVPIVDAASQDVSEENNDNIEYITLFRDLNDDDQVYASNEVLHRFGITPTKEGIMINGVESHKISRDTDQIINSIAKMSHDPKMIIKYIDLYLDKKGDLSKPRPHVEEIIDKLTDGLDIRPKDSKRYKASNLKIAKSFKDELRSGNVAYNIIHIVPTALKTSANFFRKLGAKIVTSKRARNAMSTIEERLDNLSEEELEVLFEEYKGSQLKTDMNNQINPLILDSLRSYGLHKVAKLNDDIRVNYGELFSLLGEIKALEQRLVKEDISNDEGFLLNNERKRLLERASLNVRAILNDRKQANNLLSSGVHGIEEDFKAVSTKLSYVGLRFAKTKKFDNDLQHKLGDFGRSLNTALSSNNAEAIVQSFMGLESCYYDNTEVRGSLMGKRSVGSKYYTPVAEQFDYRDDPFIRDLLSTVAISSAVTSAINAYRVNQVNSQINETMSRVHEAGEEIASKREVIQEGMTAQAHQDVLNVANVRERAILDSTGWKFNNAYHAADHAGHEAYNQFNQEVNDGLSQVSADYSQGLIDEATALERVSQVSNDAQATLYDVCQSSLDILKDYAKSHPKFDLTAVQESMEYICAHPDAISNMNQAMVDISKLSDLLTSQDVVYLSNLSTIPSNMISTIIAAASSAAMASYVSSKMNGYNKTKSTYTDEISGMMEEYTYGDEEKGRAR